MNVNQRLLNIAPVRGLLIAVVALSVLFALATLSHAQTADNEQPKQQISVEQQLRDDIARWTRILNRVHEQLESGDLTAAILDQLRTTVSDLQDRLEDARIPAASSVDRSRNLVNALGPPPKEGEPPEADEVVSQRKTLNQELSDRQGRLKQLDVLIQKSREYLARISKADAAALGEQLLAKTPSLFSWQTWRDVVTDLGAIGERAQRGFDGWRNLDEVKEAAQSGFVFVALIVVLGTAVLALLLRRWLVQSFGRIAEIEDPNYRRRVLATLAETAARTAIPILVAGAIYIALYASGVLTGFMDDVAVGALAAVVASSIIYGLPRAMLSPSLPQWRLAALGDGAAKLWYRYATTLAAIVCVDLFISIPALELRPDAASLAVYGLFINTSYAIIFFTMATDKRLWLTPEQEAHAIESAVSPPSLPVTDMASRNSWWLVGRVILAGVALAIPVTLLAGYAVLSDFIALRLLATAGLLLVALVLHGLVRDLVGVLAVDSKGVAEGPDTTNPIYVWSVLFLDIGLALTVAVLIVPLWGGHWDDILDRLGWSLTGFTIAGRQFSITDVLTGVVTFIILIVILRSVQHFINRRVLQNMRIDAGVRNSLSTGIGYVGLIIALLVAINTTGIDLSGLAIIAGALSVGVGFGLQSIVNNFVSGLILLAERPIKVGDWVEVGQHQGIVQRISVRSTEIKTFERATVIMPNSDLIANPVVNRMHRDRQGRIEVPIGVAYGSDVQKVRDILLECAARHDDILQNPAPFVLFMDFGDSALLFELRAYLSDVNRRLRISSELRFEIDEEFRKAGIEIPFPQRDLHIKSGTVPESTPAKRAPARRKTAPKRAAPSGSKSDT